MKDLVNRTTNLATIGACLLTAAGGAMDAWVYLAHGHLFANAQTGNIVLLSLHLTAGEFSDAVQIVPSIAAFIAGLACSRASGVWLKNSNWNSRNWRLASEIVILISLGFLISRMSQSIITACVGFIAAVQITSLSHIESASFNTGMTTGNLRGAASAVILAWQNPGDKNARRRAIILGWICLAFPAGALIGGACTRLFGDGTVFVIAALVTCANLVMWRVPDPLPSP